MAYSFLSNLSNFEGRTHFYEFSSLVLKNSNDGILIRLIGYVRKVEFISSKRSLGFKNDIQIELLYLLESH